MQFNSLQFFIFFPVVILCYFKLPHRYRWMLLLAASYYFYMCWEATYIFLILTSTLISFVTGLYMGQTSQKAKRKSCLILSLASNLGILFIFKYFNFFNDSIHNIFSAFNITYNSPTLNLLLPIGISFYTFQALSYTIDVYRFKKTPEKHIGIFALYISFFPQLVAGPIERSTNLLPQFYQKASFDYDRTKNGLILMSWGFFKKIVVADRLAILVNHIYNSPHDYQGLPLIIATYFFSFQIYCDFSGYSDIAIGAAQVMGIDIMNNFRQPYFSQSIREFWRRWHISLSTWFKDYFYISLGGNRVNRQRWLYNIFITFLISGLWHGANWTFVFWGSLHGFFLIFAILTSKYRKAVHNFFRLSDNSIIKKGISILITYHLIAFAWIFFRANSISDAFYIVLNLFSNFNFKILHWGLDMFEFKIALASIFLVLTVDFLQLHKNIIETLHNKNKFFRWGIYYLMVMSILLFGKFGEAQFIYFQF